MSEKSEALAYSQLLLLHADTITDSGVKEMVVNSAAELTILHLRVEALRRENERYRKQKERSYRLQRLLKECVKVMQANAVFRDTKAHKDLKTRIRVELENKR